jgi:quercetin dioxygenase-like cupin family protein
MRVFEAGDFVRDEHARGGFGRWPPGQTCEVHSHEDAIEFFVFLSGECDFEVEGETRRLRGGQGVYVEAGQKHKLTAVGDAPLDLFLCVCPNRSPTHTFYKDDGTPVRWDPVPGDPRAATGPTRAEINAM